MQRGMLWVTCLLTAFLSQIIPRSTPATSATKFWRPIYHQWGKLDTWLMHQLSAGEMGMGGKISFQASLSTVECHNENLFFLLIVASSLNDHI